MAIDISTLSNAVVKWGAIESLGLPEFEVSIPPALHGRLDVYKVPVCDAYPEGYFVKMCGGTYREFVEPGCAAWEKVLLAQIRFFGIPSDEESGHSHLNVVEYLNKVITDADFSGLNPNDYATLLKSK